MNTNLVARLSPDRRNHLLRSSVEKGDTVRRDRRNAEVWLVSSASYPNVSYRVHDGQSCGCKWFQERGTACRHMTRVSWEIHQARKVEEKAAAVEQAAGILRSFAQAKRAA